MKIIRLGFTILLIAGMAQAAENFEIISYFPDKGTVRINQGEGQTNRPFSSFTFEEQKQITDWLADQEFENSGLSVTIKKQKTTKTTTHMNNPGGLLGEVDYISYTITLENRSEVSFKNVAVNARIFYRTQDGPEEKKQRIQSTETINLSPGETRTVETKTVSIRDQKKVTPGITTGTSFSPSSGFSTTTSGGAPTVFYQDRLLGMSLCVSKKDRYGKNIKHEFEDGNPPEEEKQGAYRVSNQGAATSAANDPARKTAKITDTLRKEDVINHTRYAENGVAESACKLTLYYRRQGDQRQAKLWDARTRELVEQRLPGDELSRQILAALDQKPEETQSGDRTTSGVPEKKSAASPGSEVKILSEEYVVKYAQQAEGGSSGAAYRLCRHYSVLKDREKTVQWADKARALLAEKPPENPQATTKLLAILNQLEKEAGER